MLTKEQAIEILDKFDFFQGQRAGRELWNDKPFDVQEQDISTFSRDVALLKEYISADVVARIEFDELRRKYELSVAERDANVKGFTEQLNDLNIELAAMRGAAKSYKIHYEELAETIFSDLDGLIKIVFTPKLTAQGYITSAQSEFWGIDPKEYDAVKKKYVVERGCPNCRFFVGCEPSTLGVCEHYERDQYQAMQELRTAIASEFACRLKATLIRDKLLPDVVNNKIERIEKEISGDFGMSLEELMRAFGAVFCHECEFMEENERCSYFSTSKTDVFCGPNEFCSAGKLKTNTEEE